MQSEAPPRVIVTEDAPSYGILACVRALRVGGYEPWLASTGRSSYGRRSRACGGAFTVPDPANDAEAYAERLARAAAGLGAVAVLPGTDLALLALAGRQSLFPDDVAVGVCPEEIVRPALDKSELPRLGAEAGLLVPPTYIAGGEDSPGIDDLTYPVVIKPACTISRGAGGGLISVGVRRIESPTELRRAMALMPGMRWLIQPYLDGELEAAVGVAWRGEIVCMAQQVAERTYPVNCGISSYARTVAGEPELQARVRRLIEVLAWSGMFQVQMLKASEGHYVIDVNLRPYGSLALVVAAGLNLPTIWTNLLLGRPAGADGYRIGVRYRSEERDAGALATALFRGEWRTAARGLRPRPGTAHAIFSPRDPLPALTSLRHVRTALADLPSSRRG
jgi:predicted ATP-grasp superfamily ATP-dependent carboligase